MSKPSQEEWDAAEEIERIIKEQGWDVHALDDFHKQFISSKGLCQEFLAFIKPMTVPDPEDEEE